MADGQSDPIVLAMEHPVGDVSDLDSNLHGQLRNVDDTRCIRSIRERGGDWFQPCHANLVAVGFEPPSSAGIAADPSAWPRELGQELAVNDSGRRVPSSGSFGEQLEALALQSRRQLEKGLPIHFRSWGPRAGRQPFEQEPFDAFPAARRGLRDPDEAGHELGIFGLEPGQEEAPEPVARNRGISIGGILDRQDAGALQALRDLRAAKGEEGTKNLAVPGPDTRQARETAAEEQPEEHGFRLVVRVMGGEDHFRADLLGQGTEEVVSLVPGEALETLTARGWAGDHADSRLYAERFGEMPSRIGPALGVRIQAVIQVCCQEAEVVGLGEAAEGPEQSRRVRASGETHDDRACAPEGLVICKERFEKRREKHGSGEGT